VATDKAGNAESKSVADYPTLLDTQNPNSAASVPDYETSASFNVSYSASDPVKSGSVGPASGLATVDLYAKGPTDSSFHKVDTDSGAGIDNSFSYAASQGDGNYAFYTVATDKAGNAESKSVADDSTLLDTQQPNSQITFPTNNSDYNTSTYTAGCSTPATDICGTASDP